MPNVRTDMAMTPITARTKIEAAMMIRFSTPGIAQPRMITRRRGRRPARESPQHVTSVTARSEFDLRPQLDDPVRRQPEEARRALGIAHHRGEDLLAPHGHAAGTRGDDQRLPAEEVRRIHRRDLQAVLVADAFQQGRDVRLLHEAVARRNAVDAFTKLVELQALVV